MPASGIAVRAVGWWITSSRSIRMAGFSDTRRSVWPRAAWTGRATRRRSCPPPLSVRSRGRPSLRLSPRAGVPCAGEASRLPWKTPERGQPASFAVTGPAPSTPERAYGANGRGIAVTVTWSGQDPTGDCMPAKACCGDGGWREDLCSGAPAGTGSQVCPATVPVNWPELPAPT